MSDPNIVESSAEAVGKSADALRNVQPFGPILDLPLRGVKEGAETVAEGAELIRLVSDLVDNVTDTPGDKGLGKGLDPSRSDATNTGILVAELAACPECTKELLLAGPRAIKAARRSGVRGAGASAIKSALKIGVNLTAHPKRTAKAAVRGAIAGNVLDTGLEAAELGKEAGQGIARFIDNTPSETSSNVMTVEQYKKAFQPKKSLSAEENQERLTNRIQQLLKEGKLRK
jgi:hypothetical protein